MNVPGRALCANWHGTNFRRLEDAIFHRLKNAFVKQLDESSLRVLTLDAELEQLDLGLFAEIRTRLPLRAPGTSRLEAWETVQAPSRGNCSRHGV